MVYSEWRTKDFGLFRKISPVPPSIEQDLVKYGGEWGWDKMATICADGILKFIFLNGNVWISIKISVKFVPWGPINNDTALVQIMA